MGITIHFKGSLSDIGKLDNLVTEVEDICKIMNWEYSILEDDWSEVEDARMIHENDGLKIEGNLGLKGIGFQPHEKSEWVNLYFDKNGTLTSIASKASQLQDRSFSVNENWNFVKTQFAPVKTHIAIIKLLRHLKKNYIPDLEVKDEGDYWDTDNVEKLTLHINTIFKAMDIVEKKLETAQLNLPEEKMTSEEYADYIDKLIENSTLETEIKLRGGKMWKSENIDPHLDNAFMKHVLAFEDADRDSEIPARSLFPDDYTFPKAESMTDEELNNKLDEIESILYNHNIELGFANEIPDKVLYNYLIEFIKKDSVSATVTAGFTTVLDGCTGDCESCFQKEYCDTAKELD